jgi:uncharacterized membrane protein
MKFDKIPQQYFLLSFIFLLILFFPLVSELGAQSVNFKISIYSCIFVYFTIGAGLESHNRAVINSLIGNKIDFKSIFDPKMINRKPIMTFIRVWYFVTAWPHYLFQLLKFKNGGKF